jgi:hypothetical protein
LSLSKIIVTYKAQSIAAVNALGDTGAGGLLMIRNIYAFIFGAAIFIAAVTPLALILFDKS